MCAQPTYVRHMSQALMTAEELLRVDAPGKLTELVRGTLVVHEPPGFRHGEVMVRVVTVLARYVEEHHLGTVVTGDAGFVLARNPDTVRGPDIAFVSRERVPHPTPVGYPDLAPDLGVEVLSPGNRAGEVLGRVADLLSAGTTLVWVIDPARRLARVYRGDGSEDTVDADGALDGEDVVPGFTCRLDSVL